MIVELSLKRVDQFNQAFRRRDNSLTTALCIFIRILIVIIARSLAPLAT